VFVPAVLPFPQTGGAPLLTPPARSEAMPYGPLRLVTLCPLRCLPLLLPGRWGALCGLCSAAAACLRGFCGPADESASGRMGRIVRFPFVGRFARPSSLVAAALVCCTSAGAGAAGAGANLGLTLAVAPTTLLGADLGCYWFIMMGGATGCFSGFLPTGRSRRA